MSEFLAYLQLGFDHITDSKGYDHILFIMALCTIFTLIDYKKVVVLVTAFTIGHSATLALSTLDILHFEPALIEFLIPITILITAFINFFHKKEVFSFRTKEKKNFSRYAMALVFGFIHGLGFSNYLHMLLGQEANIIVPLLGFNIGLEIGQLLIVLILLIISFIGIEMLRIPKTTWNYIVSGIITGMALSLIIQNEFLHTLLGTAAN